MWGRAKTKEEARRLSNGVGRATSPPHGGEEKPAPKRGESDRPAQVPPLEPLPADPRNRRRASRGTTSEGGLLHGASCRLDRREPFALGRAASVRSGEGSPSHCRSRLSVATAAEEAGRFGAVSVLVFEKAGEEGEGKVICE